MRFPTKVQWIFRSFRAHSLLKINLHLLKWRLLKWHLLKPVSAHLTDYLVTILWLPIITNNKICTCRWGPSSPGVLRTGRSVSGGVAPGDDAPPCGPGSPVRHSEGDSTRWRRWSADSPLLLSPEREEASPSSSGRGTFQRPGWREKNADVY